MHPPISFMTTANQETAMDLNLGEAISKAVAAKLTTDFVEKEVDARVGKLVADAVASALNTYSETGKLIEASVKEALKVDRLDLPSYGATVSAMLREQINAKVSGLVAGQLAKDMHELLGLAPTEVKLSEIAKDMIERHDGEYGELITVIVERNDYGTCWVYLDDEEVRRVDEKYRCPHRLGVGKDGKIFSATIAGHDTKKAIHIGPTYGFEQKLRAFVACGTKLILDEDYVERGKGDY